MLRKCFTKAVKQKTNVDEVKHNVPHETWKKMLSLSKLNPPFHLCYGALLTEEAKDSQDTEYL